MWAFVLQAPDPQAVPNYLPAVCLFCWAALQELLAEPLWVLAQTHMLVQLKVSKMCVCVCVCVCVCLDVCALTFFVQRLCVYLLELFDI